MATKSLGDNILHAVGVRYNVTGSGALRTTLYSQGQTDQYVCPNITMNSTGVNRFPFILANFKNQRIQVEFRVVDENEYFVLVGINLFVKPTATGYPQ